MSSEFNLEGLESSIESFLDKCENSYGLLSSLLKPKLYPDGSTTEPLNISLIFKSSPISITYQARRCPPGWIRLPDGSCAPPPGAIGPDLGE